MVSVERHLPERRLVPGAWEGALHNQYQDGSVIDVDHAVVRAVNDNSGLNAAGSRGIGDAPSKRSRALFELNTDIVHP